MRIGITQRVEVVAGYGERRDCLDQRWFVLFESLGLTAVPVPNGLADCTGWLDAMALDGFVLSGGNDIADLPEASRPAPERDATERAVLAWAAERRLPVLGVCRGLQMMNLYLGGGLSPVTEHVACRHAVAPEPGEDLPAARLFANYREVNSFHNWGLAEGDLAGDVLPGLRSADGFIEAIRHRDLRWAGIMWHPERETEFQPQDLQLLTDLFRGAM